MSPCCYAGDYRPANRDWQPALAVTRGTTIHVYAVGVWCINVKNRKNETCGPEGRGDAGYLEAKIGKQEVKVGSSCTFKAEEAGKLAFAVCDGIRGDNDGAVMVFVTTDPPVGE